MLAVMLAVFLLSSSLLRPAHAQRTDETTPITVSYPENGEGVVVAYSAVDPEGRTVRWSLVTTETTDFPDHDDFDIDRGTLTFKTPPDYENPTSAVTSGTPREMNVYKVKVQASDGSNHTPLEVTVNVTNVDEPGVVTLPSLQPEEGVDLTASLTDPDGAVTGTLNWQWAKSSSRTGPFTDIENDDSPCGTPADNCYKPVEADVGSYLRATASYDDPEGKYKSAAAVSTNPVRVGLYTNSPPVFRDEDGEEISTTTRSVAENSATGSAVGAPVAATDIGQDGRPEILTYSLGGTDASSFDIDRATGQIKVGSGTTLNFEAEQNTYSVEVTAADPSHTTAEPSRDTITVNITVTNVEEPPTITGGNTSINYEESIEGTPNTDTVGTYTATDPEDDDNEPRKLLKWSLGGADGGRFNISNEAATRGHLTFKAEPDYEARGSADRDSVYELKVIATDSAGETASQDVTVRVINLEEAGTITLSTLQPEVGTRLTATLEDPDGSISGLTWSWSGTGTGAASATYTPNAADVGRTLRVTATYADGYDGSNTETEASDNSVISEVDNNQAPVFQNSDGVGITSTTREKAENTAGTVGDPVVATDADADHTILTYTLSGGNTDLFTIDRGTGQISVSTGATLDYDTNRSPRVTVRATDPGGLSDSITVTINLSNVDEPPDISGDDPGEYAENGTGPVAMFTARDPERASVTWSLSGDDAEDFSITGGTLRFNNPPDFETPAGGAGDDSNTYEVTVEATDHGGVMAMRPVTVEVTNVDEDGEVTLSSLQPQEGIALTATLNDPDGGISDTTWQWAWASSSRGPYTDIKDATAATYTPMETDVGRYLRATASYDDGEGKYKSASGVSDNAVRAKIYVNTDPVFQDAEGETITTTTRSVAEDAGPSVPVGEPVTATDIGENGSQEPLDYTLGGTDASSFDIDVATGQIRVGAGTALDFETKSRYEVEVTATDPEDAADTITVTITVTNVEERPTITGGPVATSYAENTDISTTDVGTYIAADDEDDNDSPMKDLTWSLSGADADDFCITDAGVLQFVTSSLSGADADDFCITDAGVLQFVTSPDFEAPTDAGGNNRYEVTVVATDSAGNTASRAVTVRVTNVDEDGVVTLSTLQPQNGISLTATLTDPDGRISGTTWQWAMSTAQDGSYTNIVGATSATYTPHSSDVGYFLRATASYTDGHGGSKTAMEPSANAVVGKATGNVAPVFPDQDPNTPGVQNTTAERSVAESAMPTNDVGAEVEATDTGDNLTYSLGGTDEASFAIERDTGQITVGAGTTLDYETRRTYTVTVTATDPSLEAATITVTIRVTAVNEAPVVSRRPLAITGRASIDYLENGTGTVAVYTASGPEAGSVRWSLTGVDAETSQYPAEG